MATASPTTTETILQEDGAEAALAAVAVEVGAAEEAIRTVLAESPDKTWTIRELQDAAAKGRSSTVMSIAFLGLLKAGVLSVDRASSVVEAA